MCIFPDTSQTRKRPLSSASLNAYQQNKAETWTRMIRIQLHGRTWTGGKPDRLVGFIKRSTQSTFHLHLIYVTVYAMVTRVGKLRWIGPKYAASTAYIFSVRTAAVIDYSLQQHPPPPFPFFACFLSIRTVESDVFHGPTSSKLPVPFLTACNRRRRAHRLPFVSYWKHYTWCLCRNGFY